MQQRNLKKKITYQLYKVLKIGCHTKNAIDQSLCKSWWCLKAISIYTSIHKNFDPEHSWSACRFFALCMHGRSKFQLKVNKKLNLCFRKCSQDQINTSYICMNQYMFAIATIYVWNYSGYSNRFQRIAYIRLNAW